LFQILKCHTHTTSHRLNLQRPRGGSGGGSGSSSEGGSRSGSGRYGGSGVFNQK
jgi:uncharacterized membrane protein YgcG